MSILLAPMAGPRPPTAPAAPAGAAPFARVVQLAKRYRSQNGEVVDAVQAASFDVQAGEFVSIVGPSGCGKSTLLKMVGGLIEPSSGTVRFADARAAQHLGMVFQDAVLLPWRTVLRNVMLPLELKKPAPADAADQARSLLQLVGLAGFEQQFPHELSGGMQQRASIARALVDDPALLLMDEPFAALDALMRDNMALELQRIWSVSRKTVMFVTHSVAEAVFLSDRIIVMSGRPSVIRDIVAVPLSRPRTKQTTVSPEFTQVVARVQELLSAETPLQ